MPPEERAKALASEVIKDGVMNWTDWQDDLADMVATAIREAIAAEREACARVAEQWGERSAVTTDDYHFPGASYDERFASNGIASAIRSRSKEEA